LQAARKLFQTILGVSNAHLLFLAFSSLFPPSFPFLPLPFENEKVLQLIAKLDGLLCHLDVDASEIDADWKQYIQMPLTSPKRGGALPMCFTLSASSSGWHQQLGQAVNMGLLIRCQAQLELYRD